MKDAFDDLSKALAAGMSRREALRRFGIAAAGAMFAFLPSRAAAGGFARNHDVQEQCREFCAFLYGTGNDDYHACVKGANHRSGACFDWGPASRACHANKCPKQTFCVSNQMNFNSTGSGYHCVPTTQ